MLIKKVLIHKKKPGDSGSEHIDISRIHENKRRFHKSVRKMVWTTLFFILLIALAWILLRSPLFRIRSISIVGTNELADADIKTLLQSRVFEDSYLKYLLGFSHILIWPDELSPEDVKFLPGLKSLKIKKDWRKHSLLILVEEVKPYGVWCVIKGELPQCGWFNSAGVIVSRSPYVEGGLIPRVSDYSADSIAIGSRVVPAHFIPNLFSILSVLENKELSIQDVRLENIELQELRVVLNSGPELYFSLRFPADRASSVIDSLRKSSKTNWTELHYVDFRVENRAYYK